jgi:penicillin-binding protein-related factor A (putative recombinase)
MIFFLDKGDEKATNFYFIAENNSIPVYITKEKGKSVNLRKDKRVQNLNCVYLMSITLF